jgi:hypothetical protein
MANFITRTLTAFFGSDAQPAPRKQTNKVSLTLNTMEERITPAGFSFDSGDMSDVGRASQSQSKKVKETTKRNELTLRDLEAGRYSTRYRERITEGSEKATKNVGETKWSPDTKFTIS